MVCHMLTVTAVYKGKHYEATELGTQVTIHAPDATCWTHLRRGRLVRSQALAATAPKRVVSRLEARLRRAGQCEAVAEAQRDDVASVVSEVEAYAIASEQWALWVEARRAGEPEAPADQLANQRGWAAWSRFLQLPETASHEEILPELDEAVQRETGRPRELANTVSDGSSAPPPMDAARLAAWAQLVGLPEIASREEILEHLTLDTVSDYSWRFVSYDTWQPPITQGSPAYMQALVAQITPETARLWADAWGCAPDALAERVLEPGPGDLVDSDTARELSRRILADVGQPAVDGARRADRSALARHNDPDIPEDLEYYDDTPEPLEDVEWLRGVLADTEGPT